jgi:hypothetical protein
MSAVMGATTTIKTLADGTFRLAIDIEPRFAQQAFALFGAPGTPIALARITNEAANEHAQREPEPERAKGGPLARLAGMLCEDPDFWKFAVERFGGGLTEGREVQQCAKWMRQQCNIQSRAELDSNEEAAEHFHEYIRKPWLTWKQARGAA